jgi:hypothetical protein
MLHEALAVLPAENSLLAPGVTLFGNCSGQNLLNVKVTMNREEARLKN